MSNDVEPCTVTPPPVLERDHSNGHWAAYNDDIRVAAVACTEQEAITHYYESAYELRKWLAEGHPPCRS